MASINTIVKRKQYLWLGIVVVGTASAIGGALYLSDVDMSGNGETVAEQEPVPDMTGVVDTTFDDKVRQHATTEMQVTAAQMQKQYEEIRRELNVLNKQRGDDQRRIEKLGQDNAALAEQVKALGANPVTATGEPVPQMPASPPGPEGEPQPGNTPVSFPPQGSVAVPPPTAFYPGNGVTPPPQVTYQSVPVPNRIQRKVFTRNEGKQGPSLPYIPSGSFAKAMLIEGADANASVTGNESTVPMQLRITGLVEMPNSKTYDATGCFVGLEAWGDVSSERAIVRTRNISCLKDGKTIDMPIKGHVSFRGKNGIKGEVVMRNGKILGWAWGAGFVDGIGQGMERASQPAVGLGATAAYGAGDVLKMGIGGGASKAAQTLSDYYIKRAEQYHPVIPIGAGNEVTVVFQDGFQLKTVEEMALERTQSRAEEDNPESPVPVPPSAESHLEAVTQAVNSLVTALKLPDESAKANEVLGEMSFPQFSRLLPYRDYNQESGLFMNDTTMGFMLEAIPINGANESIVEALDHMLRTKLPRGIPLCIHLMSSQLVGDRIEYGLREFSWSGEQAERFNAITRAYYMKAAATQFPLPEGMNLPLTLRH
ncbi:F-type conjugal transfer pilus assembly protein TraB [Escherichia coli O157:H51]